VPAAGTADAKVPQFSVVVAWQHAGQPLASCLASLRAQTGLPAGAIEVIVASGLQGKADPGGYPQPDTGACLVEADGGSLPILHGLGIAASRGRLVALTEAHCTFPPDWATLAIAAHGRSDAAAIGGAVEPGASLRAPDWALYFCDYGQFLPPLTAGPTRDLPGNNVVFRRDVLDRAPEAGRVGFWKTFYCLQLADEGHLLLADPSLVVSYHRRLSPAGIVRRRFVHGRCFGAMRARRSSRARRVLFALAGPAVPWLMLARLVRRAWPKRRFRRQLLGTMPLALLCLFVWAVGEWMGNLFGAGCSCSEL